MIKKGVDQLYTLLCYGGALVGQLILSMVLSGLHLSGQLDDNAYIYLCYLVP